MPKSFNDLPTPVQGFIFVVVAVALAAGTFWYYVLPLNDQRTGLDKDVTKLKAENDKNEAFRQQQTEYLSRIAQLEKQLETLRSIVPDEQATEQFMKMVAGTAVGAGTNVRTFIAQPLVRRDFYTEMPFVIRLDGTFFNLLGFFDRLSREQRIVSVTGLALGAPAGGGMGTFTILPNETVGANCVVTTYFHSSRAEEPAAPALKKK
jgi:type IV pilus assembly protein PilO